jgi:hypothetical protein
METHCRFVYLKITDVQNDHPQHQCKVDKGVEESAVTSLWKTLHHSNVPGKLTSGSSVTSRFSVAQYTELCRLKVQLSLKVAS